LKTNNDKKRIILISLLCCLHTMKRSCQIWLIFCLRRFGYAQCIICKFSFMSKSLLRHALILSQLKEWLRYSNHLVTDGRFVGHGGYGGHFLLIKL